MSVPNLPDDTNPVSGLITRAQTRALDHAAALERGDTDPRYGVVPNLLTRFSLIPPRGIDASGARWSRRNDHASIVITPGSVLNKRTGELDQAPLPAGGLANLSFLWAVNQVRANLAREVDEPERIRLGATLADFLRSVGIAKGGKQYQQALRALRSVFDASIQLHVFSEHPVSGIPNGRHRMIRADVASSYDLWDSDGNELEGFEPYAVASPALIALAQDSRAVPMRMDLLGQLADSVLAQQALNWLAFNVYRLDVSGDKALEFTWDDLFRNITHNRTDPEKFRTDWKKAVTRAVGYWPEVRDHLDLSAVPSVREPGSGRQRVIRLRRGARPLVSRKEIGAGEAS